MLSGNLLHMYGRHPQHGLQSMIPTIWACSVHSCKQSSQQWCVTEAKWWHPSERRALQWVCWLWNSALSDCTTARVMSERYMWKRTCKQSSGRTIVHIHFTLQMDMMNGSELLSVEQRVEWGGSGGVGVRGSPLSPAARKEGGRRCCREGSCAALHASTEQSPGQSRGQGRHAHTPPPQKGKHLVCNCIFATM